MKLIVLAFKSVVNRKTHLITTIVMMAIATAGLFVSALMAGGLNNGLNVGLQRLGADIIILPKAVSTNIEETIFTGVPMNIYMPKEVLEKVQNVSGITQFTPQFFTQTLNESCCSLGNAYRLVGFDPATDFVIQPWMQAHLGRSLQNSEIIIGAKVESFIGGRAVILDESFNVAGQLEATGTSIDETIFMPIDTAKRLATNSPYLQGLWQQNGAGPADLLSAILIKLSPDVLPSQVIHDLGDIPYANAIQAAQINRQVKQQIVLVNNLLISANILLWTICLVAVWSFFLRNTLQKKTEVGILRALGATRWDVIKIVVIEAVGLCMAGSLVGVALGELLWHYSQGKILASSALPYLSVGFGIHLQWGLLALLAGVGVGIVASLYPAFYCASLDPARAISSGELE